MTYQDILKASEGLQTMPIKGKEYVTVNERVKAFRKLLPDGTITTDIISQTDSMVVMVAKVFDGDRLLATGTAFETKDSSYINKTSYIENCETSAVGRALAFLGLGIDASIASSDEVENAITQQTASQAIGVERAKALAALCAEKGVLPEVVCGRYGVERLADLTEEQHRKAVTALEKSNGNNRKA